MTVTITTLLRNGDGSTVEITMTSTGCEWEPLTIDGNPAQWWIDEKCEDVASRTRKRTRGAIVTRKRG
jgi:hypothetical protein